jgi:nucleotide-binding universal stress UspA family protein
MKPILLGTDGSPSAEKATRLAVELARETGSRLCVVAAWQAPLTNYAYTPMATIPEVEAAERKRAHEAAKAALKLAEAEGVDAESFERNGDAVEMISQTAEACEASLVVVGSHGWGAVRRLVFGSVSTGLLHHAPCPVLVARLDEESTPADAEKTKEVSGA